MGPWNRGIERGGVSRRNVLYVLILAVSVGKILGRELCVSSARVVRHHWRRYLVIDQQRHQSQRAYLLRVFAPCLLVPLLCLARK